MTTVTGMLTLKTLLGDYPNTAAFRQGGLKSSRVAFDFADVKTPNHAFKRVVRDIEFDVAELAIITFLQARAHGKPLVLVPAVVRGKFQHDSIACSAGRPLAPKDLDGRRIGIRAYSVTAVAWVRGILQNDYGVDLDSIRWVTLEDPHVTEYRDPPNAERAPAGKQLMPMLLDGEVDAIVTTGKDLKDPRVRPVIPEPDAAAQAWYERYKAVPINHMVCIKESVLAANPRVAEEVFRLLAEAKKAAGLPKAGEIDRLPFGVEPNRKSLELAIQYAAQQRLIPRAFAVDELFNDVTRVLGR